MMLHERGDNYKVENIFFDADGVLFASENFEDSISRVLKKYELDNTIIRNEVEQNIHKMHIPNEWLDTLEKEEMMWRNLYEHIFREVQMENKERVLVDLLENAVYYKNSYLLEGVTEFLEMHINEFTYYMITNSYPSVYYVLDHLGLRKYFKKIISSSDVHICKPEIMIFEYALDVTKCKAEESFFVDDNELNVAAANKVGMKGIQFNNRCNDLRQLEKHLQSWE